MNKNIFPIRKVRLTITGLILFFLSLVQVANAVIPRPDHVVFCILENHSYQQIIGSASAPYLNTLVNQSANLQEYYALTHPSQPNYLMLFSGSNQGETTDNLPSGCPWNAPNLGASLINSGFTFGGYSEGLPAIGSLVATSGGYARKHSPWVNWQGNGTNQIPSYCNMTMNDFPSNYDQLPDLSFVIPNCGNDMHDGSDPSRIATGDAWVKNHLKNYVDWAQTHNSLFILTFDEDDFSPVNHIPCIFVGPMVRQGNYYLTGYSHYDMLRTLEDMYGLPYAGNSIHGHSMSEIWMTPTDVQSISSTVISGSVFPNPLTDNSQIIINNDQQNNSGDIHLLVYDIVGRVRSEEIIMLMPGINSYPFRKEGLASGIYTYQLRNEGSLLASGKVTVE